MLMTILYIIIIGFSLYFTVYYLSGSKDFFSLKKKARIPGPLSLPLIGCAYLFIGSPEYVFNQFVKTVKRHKSPIRFPIGLNENFVITNPEHIKTIIFSNKAVEKQKFAYKILSVLTGRGLITAENKLWRVHRKLLQPTFSAKILETFVSIFQTNTFLLTQEVEKHVGCTEVDLSQYIARAFFSSICESSMGVSVKTKSKEIEKFMIAGQRIFALMFERFIRLWLHKDKIFNLSQTGKQFLKYKNQIYWFTKSVIESRKQYWQSCLKKNTEASLWNRSTTLDLMLELSDNGKKFTVEEICEHVINFIMGGYDTASRVTNFILLMLASYPDVQDKVYDEIFNIYGDEDVEKTPIKYEDLHHLKYLERVIKETMRLFPVAALISRQLSEDIEIDGHLLPKNCGIVISIFHLHRDETFWPNPLKFDPDRFLPENSNKRHPCAFMPFSFGSRDCIGRVYAMILMKVFLVIFLRKYKLKKDKITPAQDIKLKMDLLLRTVEPITLRLEKRK